MVFSCRRDDHDAQGTMPPCHFFSFSHPQVQVAGARVLVFTFLVSGIHANAKLSAALGLIQEKVQHGSDSVDEELGHD